MGNINKGYKTFVVWALQKLEINDNLYRGKVKKLEGENAPPLLERTQAKFHHGNRIEFLVIC